MKINKLALFILCTLSILLPIGVLKAESDNFKSLKSEIDNFYSSFMGTEEDWKQVTDPKSIYAELINSKEKITYNSKWPLMISFVYHYKKAEEKNWKDFKFPYDYKKWVELRTQGLIIKNKVNNFVSNQQFTQTEKQQIAMAFELGINLPLNDLIDVLDLQKDSSFTIVYPATLLTSDENWIRSKELIPLRTRVGSFTIQKSPTLSLLRQMSILFAVPTSHFYYKLVRLNHLQSTLVQLANYTQIISDKSALKMPLSCQNSLNGNLPDILPINLLDKGQSTERVENILINSGLLVGSADPAKASLLDAAIENSIDSFNPGSGGVGGVLPFETYLAQIEGKKRGLNDPKDRPLIDPAEHFYSLIDSKLGPIIGEELNNKKNLLSLDNVVPEYKKQLEQEVTQLQDLLDQFSSQVQIGTPSVSITKFLANKLNEQKLEINDYEKLFSNEKLYLLQSNKIMIDRLPSFQSSWMFKRWVFNTMINFANKYLDDSNDIDSEIRGWAFLNANQACRFMTGSKPIFCPKDYPNQKWEIEAQIGKEIVEGMQTNLSPFEFEGERLSSNAEHDQKFESTYRFIQYYWMFLVGDGYFRKVEHLPEATIKEADFLYTNVFNQPLAQWRIQYILWTQIKNNYLPAVQKIIDKMFAAILLDKPISPLWADQLLTEEERMQFWLKQKDGIDENSGYIFNAPIAQNDQREFYDILLLIQKSNLMDRDSTQSLAKSISKNVDNKDLLDSLSTIYSSKESAQLALFLQAYNSRGDINAFRSILDSQFTTKADIARAYYKLDTKIRSALNVQAIREASLLQRERALQTLDQICQMTPQASTNDGQKFLALTMKAQSSLMQEHSVEMPKSISEVTKAWTEGQWANLWFGLGAGVLSIATIVSLGLSAPITAPLAAVMAYAALSLDVISVGAGVGVYLESEKNKSDVEFYRSLGQTTRDGKAIVDKGGAEYLAAQVLFFIPNVNMVRLTTKLVLSTMKAYNKGLFYGVDAASKRLVYQSIKTQLNLALSKKVLGYSGANAAKGEVIDASKIVAPYAADLKALDVHVSGRISKLYSNSPEVFKQNYFDRMLKPFLNKMQKKLNTLEAAVQKAGNNNPQAIFAKYKGVDAFKTISKAEKKYLIKMGKLRMKMSLYSKVVEDFKCLPELDKQLSRAISNGRNLDEFLGENMDSFSKIIPHLKTGVFENPLLPVSKLFSATRTSPILGTTMSKIPGLGRFFDGPIVKRLISARNVYAMDEAQQISARQLGLSGKLNSTSFDVYQNFQLSLLNALEKASDEEAIELIAKWEKVEAEVAAQVWENLHPNPEALKTMSNFDKLVFTASQKLKNSAYKVAQTKIADIDQFQTLLRSGDPLARMAFNSMRPADVFGIKVFKDTAHDVALKMANFDNMDEFERYFNAMKIMMMSERPDIINILL